MEEITLEGDNKFREITFDDVGQTTLETLVPSVKDLKEVTLSLAEDGEDDGNPLFVRQQIEAGFVGNLEGKARTKNVLNVTTRVKEDFTGTLTTGGDVSDTDLVESGRVLEEVSTGAHPDVGVFPFSTDIEGFTKLDKLATYRLERARIIGQEQFETSDGGFWNGLGYFADVVISVPRDILGGGGFVRDSNVDKIIKLAHDPSVTAEEYDTTVRQIFQDVADTGLFSDNNWFYTSQFIDDMENNGGTLDKAFTVLDAVTLGTGGVAKSLFKLRTSVEIAAATGPHNRAGRLIAARVVAGDEAPDVAASVSPAMSRPMDTSPSRNVYNAPAAAVRTEVEVENTVARMVNKRDFGGSIQPDVWESIQPDLVKKVTTRALELSDRSLVDVNTELDNLGNITGVAIFGTPKGKFFGKNQKWCAERFAEEVDGEVFEILQEGEIQFGVRRSFNLPTEGLVTPLSETEVTTNLFSLVGSPYLTSSFRLDAIIKAGEAQREGVINEVISLYSKTRSAASRETKAFVDEVYEELRDGVGAARREALSQPEFKELFQNRFGRVASSKDLDYFRVINEMNDTAYTLAADTPFKNMVNAGFRIIRDENNLEITVRPATEDLINRSKPNVVWNLETGRPIDFPDDLSGVYLVDNFHQVGDVPYGWVYTSKPKGRRLFHSDALGYNVGGPRVTSEYKFFVAQESEFRLAGYAENLKGKPRVFMGGFTHKEMLKATEEIRVLFTRLRELIPDVGATFKNDMLALRGLARSDELEQFVARHTAWNGDVSTVDELANFLESRSLNFRKDVGVKTSDQAFEDPLGILVGGSARGEQTYQDIFSIGASFRQRGDTPLIGYGGRKGRTLPMAQAVERNLARQLTLTSEAAYRKNAVEGWLKGVEISQVVKKLPQGENPLARMKNAEVNLATKKGRAFAQERKVILRRIANDDWLTKAWKQKVSTIAEFVYDKGAKKMGVSIENMLSPNPVNALRSLAFHQRLGIFAFPQLLIQSNQVVNVAAIGGVNGFRGAAAALPIRLALYNGNGSVVREIGRRSAGLLGIKPEEFEELIKFIKFSGRDVIGSTVAEFDQKANLITGNFKQALKYGRVFFDEGERFARMAAAGTAYIDFKKAFPKADIFSVRSTNWMTARMDILTQGMTSASASAVQRDTRTAAAVQFLSYTARMTEQLFSSRILTAGERIRLGSAQLLFWGATGVGAGSLVDAAIENDVVSLTEDEYIFARRGLLDFVVFETTGAKTTFSDRFSFPDALFDLVEKMTEGKFWEVIGGASVEISSSTAGDALRTVGNMIHGRYDLAQHDATALVHSLSGLSTGAKAYWMFSAGKYFSRRGDEVVSGLTDTDAWFTLLGSTPAEVGFTYEKLISNKKRDDALREIGRTIKGYVNGAMRKYAEGDEEGGRNMLMQAAAIITPLEVYERDFLIGSLTPDLMNLLDKVILKEATDLAPDELFNTQLGRGGK